MPLVGVADLSTLLQADRASPAAAARLRPRVASLAELDLLAGADRTTLERLAPAAQEVVMPAGGVIIRAGDDADALWILARGELSVWATGDVLEPRELPPVTGLGYVGEFGLLHGIAHRHRLDLAGVHAAADRRPGLPGRPAGQPAEPLATIGDRDPDGPPPDRTP